MDEVEVLAKRLMEAGDKSVNIRWSPGWHRSLATEALTYFGERERELRAENAALVEALRPFAAGVRVVMTFSEDDGKLYDAIAVNLQTNKVRLFDTGKRLPDAEAISAMAVMRQGVDEEFYAEVPTGMYKDEDTWRGKE